MIKRTGIRLKTVPDNYPILAIEVPGWAHSAMTWALKDLEYAGVLILAGLNHVMDLFQVRGEHYVSPANT